MRSQQLEWLKEKKRKSKILFIKAPMPDIKNEEWRYTRINDLNLSKMEFDEKACVKITCLDASLEKKGVIFTDMKSAMDNHPDLLKKYYMRSFSESISEKFVLMNSAFWNDGVFIYVPENVQITFPLMTIFSLNPNKSKASYSMIIAEKNSQLKYFEQYLSPKGVTKNVHSGLTEVFAKENSRIDFNTLQNLSNNFYDFSFKRGIAEKNSAINWFFGYFGGKLSKLKVETVLNGEGSRSENNGIFFGSRSQHFDITTDAYHKVPNTTNNILTEGVLKDESSSVYHGLIKIEKGAQKTDSYLANHNLILTSGASTNSIPSLKIDANNVKATHGVTASRIDENQLFYLMSRGLKREAAEMLIVEGFLESVLKKAPIINVREMFRKIVEWRVKHA